MWLRYLPAFLKGAILAIGSIALFMRKRWSRWFLVVPPLAAIANLALVFPYLALSFQNLINFGGPVVVTTAIAAAVFAYLKRGQPEGELGTRSR